MTITVDYIAGLFPHLTRDEIGRRAALTPEMMERIAEHRSFVDGWLADPAGTDEEIALGFVLGDAANEWEARPKEVVALTGPKAYAVSYVNETGARTIDADFSLESAMQMSRTLYTAVSKLDGRLAWGNVRSVTITRTDRPLDTRTIAEIEAEVIS